MKYPLQGNKMTENKRLKVKSGATVTRNEKDAVQELFKQINQPEMDAVIFFCSSGYDLAVLGNELKKTFPCTLIGCTTAGEISPEGYQDGGIVGASISSPEIKLHSRVISPLNNFGFQEAQKLTDSIRQDLSFSDRFNKEKMFGFLMIDGLSATEENIIATLYNHFEWIPIIGGSAGDDLQFTGTKVYSDGEFKSDAAVFTVFETSLPFYIFKTQHFLPTEKKLVITGADPSCRIVTEINGETAAKEFAELLGITESDLNPLLFSKYPLMLKIGDEWYVRSIQKANKDGSLSFFCAIDVGLVLTVGEGDDLINNFKELLNKISREIPSPALIIGCDCGLRKMEIIGKGITDEMGDLLKTLNFIGFSTYGEQYNSIHVNQTLTGVAIGGY
jgi:hypothetical protein